MSLDILADRYDMRSKVRGVVHGGAHLAEEAEDYRRIFGDIPVLWIEANPRVIHSIQQHLNGGSYFSQRVVNALISNQNEVRQFNVTNHDGMSSSIFEFGTHPTFSPETIFVERISLQARTLDDIVRTEEIDANFLNLDIQGAELLALQGATELCKKLDYALLEVNKAEVYQGCAKIWDLDDILLENGLRRMETFWVAEQGWGDALWVRI